VGGRVGQVTIETAGEQSTATYQPIIGSGFGSVLVGG